MVTFLITMLMVLLPNGDISHVANLEIVESINPEVCEEEAAYYNRHDIPKQAVDRKTLFRYYVCKTTL